MEWWDGKGRNRVQLFLGGSPTSFAFPHALHIQQEETQNTKMTLGKTPQMMFRREERTEGEKKDCNIIVSLLFSVHAFFLCFFFLWGVMAAINKKTKNKGGWWVGFPSCFFIFSFAFPFSPSVTPTADQRRSQKNPLLLWRRKAHDTLPYFPRKSEGGKKGGGGFTTSVTAKPTLFLLLRRRRRRRENEPFLPVYRRRRSQIHSAKAITSPSPPYPRHQTEWDDLITSCLALYKRATNDHEKECV